MEEVRKEVSELLGVLADGWEKSGFIDLEASEMATRSAVHRAGARVLTGLLEQEPPEQREIPCGCGGMAKYVELRSKVILTVVGEVQVRRGYYLCSDCHHGQAPFDRELDIERVEASPGVRRMAAVVGNQSAFEVGHNQLKLLADLDVSAKAVERYSEAIGADIGRRESDYRCKVLGPDPPPAVTEESETMYVEMDATSVPVVPRELEGRAGREPGEKPRSRDAKLGCVFTQTTVDEDGHPIRDEASTTYTGAIETAEEFGRRIYAEAYKRGCCSAARLVVLADGALWIWILAALHFPQAIQIVDLYHARKHLWDLAAKLFSDPKARSRWVKRVQRMLDAGRIEALVTLLRKFPPADQEAAEAIRIEAAYFERNADRMRYPKFKRQGLFVGSGVIEAGCKNVIGSRLKQSGMFWTVRGATSIIELRCCILSDNFEDYWASRSAA